MAVRRQGGMLNDVANNFWARHGRVQIALPLTQQLTRQFIVAGGQGIANAREMVAEAPETQGGIKDRQTPEHGQQPAAKPPQQPMHQHGQQTWQANGQAPSGPGMPLVTRIQGVTQPVGPMAKQLVNALTR